MKLFKVKFRPQNETEIKTRYVAAPSIFAALRFAGRHGAEQIAAKELIGDDEFTHSTDWGLPTDENGKLTL